MVNKGSCHRNGPYVRPRRSYVLQNQPVSRGCLVDGPSLFRIAAEILRYDFADF